MKADEKIRMEFTIDEWRLLAAAAISARKSFFVDPKEVTTARDLALRIAEVIGRAGR